MKSKQQGCKEDSYEIYIGRRAEKDLENIEKQYKQLVDKKLNSLAQNPRIDGVEKVKTTKDSYKTRAGKYRIIFLIDDSERKIVISRIKLRNECTYKIY